MNPAISKAMSRRFASSCRFMWPDNPDAPDDAVTLSYLSHFDMLDHPSSYLGSFDDMRPFDSPSEVLPPPGSNAPAAPAPINCVLEAAGRNWMARKDKSLTQAYEAYESGNYAEARARFEQNWNKLGYEESALMLGRLHLLGLGTSADTPQAIKWLREVVEAPFHPVEDRLLFDPRKPGQINTRIEATLLLARIHLMGLGTPREPAKALALWRKALDFGFEPANTLIGQAYVSGVGAAADGPQAVDALTAAAAAGHTPAMLLLGQLYHHRVFKQPAGIPLNLEKAGAYYGAAARAGDIEATYAAARMLDLGEGTPRAPEKALVLYKEAALKGHADAQNALATYFYRGEVVEKNLATARQFFKAAAERSQPDAMFNLAVMLAHGQGGDRDLAAAYAWCSLSKRLGHAQAEAALPAIGAQLSADEKSRADAMLKPAPMKS